MQPVDDDIMTSTFMLQIFPFLRIFKDLAQKLSFKKKTFKSYLV